MRSILFAAGAVALVLVAFVAPGVVNHGVITARLGEVTLASGNKFTVGTEEYAMRVDQPHLSVGGQPPKDLGRVGADHTIERDRRHEHNYRLIRLLR
ncbi:hypothetical protein WCLP8_2550004 [uncultured Gammaproteobacteria bacterium]